MNFHISKETISALSSGKSGDIVGDRIYPASAQGESVSMPYIVVYNRSASFSGSKDGCDEYRNYSVGIQVVSDDYDEFISLCESVNDDIAGMDTGNLEITGISWGSEEYDDLKPCYYRDASISLAENQFDFD